MLTTICHADNQPLLDVKALISLLVPIIQAHPGLLARAIDSFACETDGAADFCGFGVRLGIYFAWANAYIANTLLPSEIAGASDTNNIFLLVILIAMIKCSANGMLTSIDGLILMHLSGGFLFGTLSIWGYRTRQYFDNGPRGIRFFGGFGTHSRLMVSLMISDFGLWFCTFGVVDGLVHPGTEEEIVEEPTPRDCATLYTFMFAKVRADARNRIFYIIMCVGCIVYYGIMLLASGIAAWARLGQVLHLYRERRWAETTRLHFATGFKYGE
ncbi:hypothetical protein GCG54_00008246 [Colletotrichum gloeosporioides]|uniref:Uncharacterized protein n=1 Tax=Colletotrichum gloeosporioides TaxID=474922 RepID=A0A8H4C7P0_COLGL|nr:uncharacterized protein GCG54_00008246 [Colletotrichum gloeosporioides]KAF3798790.1 hypothetical protein GCG54_00008246 [Colletotrichum gloeosporioides]